MLLDTSEYEIPQSETEYSHPEEGYIFIKSVDAVEISGFGMTYSVTTHPPDYETMDEYNYEQEICIEIFVPFS